MNHKPPKGWLSLSQYTKESAAKSHPATELSDRRYSNRDLSWLTFNARVLSEAANRQVPLLERLRFAAIVSSNLDEFFMVRVSEILKIARRTPSKKFPDGYFPKQVLSGIRESVTQQKADQARIVKEILKVLAKNKIYIHHHFAEHFAHDTQIKERLPDIQIILRPIATPPPFLFGDSLYVFILFPKEYAILRLRRQDRLVRLEESGIVRYVLLERWLSTRAKEIFSDKEVLESFAFKILRDADLRFRSENEDTLEEQIVQAVERRRQAPIVRLEADSSTYTEGVFLLASALGVSSSNLYRFNLPLDLSALMKIYNQLDYPKLKYAPIQPQVPRILSGQKSIFELLKARDILLHHPYDSFDCVIRLLEESATDPNVTEIYHTLYRTTEVSPVMESLKKAAINGKKVIVYVEIKARFDELNNVRWASNLRASGVRVIRHIGRYKVHSKATVISRKENDSVRLYAHLGTGNYHPNNARQYTDLSLLTSNQNLVQEAFGYFKALSGRSELPEFKKLLVSPKNLRSEILRLIQNEVTIQKQGGKGRIIAKLNALTDTDIIDALYKASESGVKIQLIVRGSCCLRPGIRGLSSNIEVISIIDRFLEHSRIYYFRAGGERKVYLSSADWRPRNFFSRYEVAFPIEDPSLKKYIYEIILKNALNDNIKSWRLQKDSTYQRTKLIPNAEKIRSQFLFESLSKTFYKNTTLEKR